MLCFAGLLCVPGRNVVSERLRGKLMNDAVGLSFILFCTLFCKRNTEYQVLKAFILSATSCISRQFV